MMPKPDIEFDALGTHWWIELPEDSNVTRLRAIIIERVTTFETDYSRFLPTSLIGKLNINKSLDNPPQGLLDMLAFAREMYQVSNGIFNISVGGTLAQLGYGKSQPHAKLKLKFWDQVVMNDQLISIPENSEIDFGGFGKGWLIDELGGILENEGCQFFVINGGGDILVKSVYPVELALEHPLNPALKIGTTRVYNGALAVSSTVKRAWKQGTKKHHHIIDPRREASSDSPVIATYIRAESALIADTMATILLIAPELRDSLSERYGLQAILLDEEVLIKS